MACGVLTLSSVEWAGAALTIDASTVTITTSEDWNPDKISFTTPVALDPRSQSTWALRTLKIELQNYQTPVSTQPLITGWAIEFKYTYLTVAYSTTIPLTSSLGLTLPAVNWVNNPAETLDFSYDGTITVGQGDIGIDAAAYSFEWKTEVEIPRDAEIDIMVPAGFGYQFSETVAAPRTTVETGRMSGTATDLNLWAEGVVNTDEQTPGVLRVKGLFV